MSADLGWDDLVRGAGLHDGADRLAVAARRALEAGLTTEEAGRITEGIVEESLAAHRRSRTAVCGLAA